MNCLFLTQSRTLSAFFQIAQIWTEAENTTRTGFYVSDSMFFRKFARKHPEIESDRFDLLKEWEIIRKAQFVRHDLERLKSYERRYGDPVLWNAIVSDRRIWLGKKAPFEQDYATRFSHDQILAILQVAVEQMEQLFDQLNPDVVVCFICVTLGEYLAYRIAKRRKIQFVDLRPTRINNYFYAGGTVHEPSKHLERTYRNLLSRGLSEDLEKKVSNYLKTLRNTHAMYEGVLPVDSQIASTVKAEKKNISWNKVIKISGKSFEAAKQLFNYHIGAYKHDNSYRGTLYPHWFQRIKQPLRNWTTKILLNRYFVDPAELPKIEFAFYPLHKEPEVTLLVYGRPFLNQLEVIRNYARSLPVGMKLVVKEHPGAVGYRKLSYYRKLLSIPNVIFVAPWTPSRKVIEHARIITIIGGSIGLESIMMKKPLIVLGKVPFAFFPKTMVRYIDEPDSISTEILDLIANHKHDERLLKAYIASVMETSIPVNFYSEILERKGVFVSNDKQRRENDRQDQHKALGNYIIRCYTEREKEKRNT